MDERGSKIIVVGSVAVVLGLVFAWAFIPSAEDRAAAAPLTELSDRASIQNHVLLSHLSIATSENFARQKIRVISAVLKNASDKPVRMVEVKLTFTDFDEKAIYDYTRKILDKPQRPLLPGMEFRFEVRLENLPRTWNYRVPITEVTRIGF